MLALIGNGLSDPLSIFAVCIIYSKADQLTLWRLAVNQLILGALIVSAERWAVFTHKSSLNPSKVNTDFDDLHYDNDMTIILTEKT